jgi:hypothetical protein
MKMPKFGIDRAGCGKDSEGLLGPEPARYYPSARSLWTLNLEIEPGVFQDRRNRCVDLPIACRRRLGWIKAPV